MKTPQSVVETNGVYTCGRCTMFYYEYKQLVEHLYWKHGTESHFCNKCGLKKWRYALHVCHVLPIEDDVAMDKVEAQCQSGAEPVEYCSCGRNVDAPMIGCDGPQCSAQWYHFACVGIVVPPDGDWFCPDCILKEKKQKQIEKKRT